MSKSIISSSLVIMSLSSFLNMSPVWGSEAELIILKDNRDQAEYPPEVVELRNKSERYQRESRRFIAARRGYLKERRRILEDMETNGFSIVDGASIETEDDVMTKLLEASDNQPIELAYEPVDLNTAAFRDGRLIAEGSMHRDRGRTYEMSYVYRFDDLGTVVVNELNYVNLPDTKTAVPAPAANLYVNGIAASYFAVTNEEGSRGMTTITFFTRSKIFTVTALKCITRKDRKAFRHLVQVASSLY